MSFAVVRDVPLSATSARLIVFNPNDEWRARPATLHFRSARAARICALESGLIFILYVVSQMGHIYHMVLSDLSSDYG